MSFNFGVVAEYHQLFFKGTLLAIGMTIVCVAIGIVLGILLGMGRLAAARHICVFRLEHQMSCRKLHQAITSICLGYDRWNGFQMTCQIHPLNGGGIPFPIMQKHCR